MNEGVAFSISQDWWWMEWVVWGTVAALLLLYIKYQILNIKNTNKKLSINKNQEKGRNLEENILATENMKLDTLAYGLIVGGAVSNLIDRVLWGGVVDYIRIDPFGWGLPVFNVGDVGICTGMGIWLLKGVKEVLTVISHPSS